MPAEGPMCHFSVFSLKPGEYKTIITREKGDSTITLLLRSQNWPLKLQQYEIKIWCNSAMTSSELETRKKTEGLPNQYYGEGCDNTQADHNVLQTIKWDPKG